MMQMAKLMCRPPQAVVARIIRRVREDVQIFIKGGTCGYTLVK
jgi:hypothetical protein